MKTKKKDINILGSKAPTFIKRCIKSSFYEKTICLFVLISLLLIITYLVHIGGNISNSNADWGHFGSFLGAITGLLAFAGAFHAINKSDIQTKKAQEMGYYNTAVETYYDIINNIRYKNKIGNEAIIQYSTDLVFYDFLYLLSSNPDNVFKKLEEKTISSKDISDEERKIYNRLSPIFPEMFSSIDSIFKENPQNQFKEEITTKIKEDLLKGKSMIPVDSYYRAIHAVNSNMKDNDSLDRYFQFVFSMIDFFQNKMSQTYLELFYSQITAKELFILFHTSFAINPSLSLFSSFSEYKICATLDPSHLPLKILEGNISEQQNIICNYTDSIFSHYKSNYTVIS